MKINLKGLLCSELIFALLIFRYQIIRITESYIIYPILIFGALFILIKERRINKAVIILNCFVLCIIFLNYFIYKEYRREILNVIDLYFYAGVIATILFSYCKNYRKLIDIMTLIGIVNIFITIYMFLNKEVYHLGYMDFGYFLLPSSILLYLKYFKEKNIKYLIGSILTIIIIFIYGSRGAILCYIGGYLMINMATFKATLKNLNSLFIKIIIGIILLISINPLLSKVNNTLIENGIFSYSLTKYTDTTEDFASGRVERYNLAIEDIKKHPIVGNGIGNYNIKYSYNYIHNFILQIADELGILLLLLVIIFIIKFIVKIINDTDKDKQLVFTFIFSITIKLMISTQYWSEPTFWIIILLGMQFTKKSLKLKDNI